MVLTDPEQSPQVLRSVAEEDACHADKERALENFFLHVLYSKNRRSPPIRKKLRIRISMKDRREPPIDWVRMALNGWDKSVVVLKDCNKVGTGRLLSVVFRDPAGGSNAFVRQYLENSGVFGEAVALY